MKKTLGLDLGTNSLGWAILDDITLDVVDKGVVIFPEGVDLDAGTSTDTPAAKRRAARMARRMKFRRKLRKWMLLKVLIENGFCPLLPEELQDWKARGIYPLGNADFIAWLKATDTDNPYCDRAAAASGKVGPYVLGRALYHICQRRGFKSSRKEEAALVDEETGEVKKADKDLGKVKSDISALTKEIADAGCKTLGQYFYKCLQADLGKMAKGRVRCRYTGRLEHYEKEFSVIMAAQGIKQGRPDKLFEHLHNAIFYQRPLRSQKFLVGKCPLEPKSPRAQIGHPDFEEFRMLSLVNNMSLEDADRAYRDDDGNFLYPLSAEDRALVCKALTEPTGKARTLKPNVKFDVVVKLFAKDPRFKQGLRFHYYREDDSLPTCLTRFRIKSAFGGIPYDEQKVFDALMFYNDTELLRDWFRRHYPNLDDKQVAALLSIHPKEGNAEYSLKAIRKILRFLRKGYQLSEARLFARLPDFVNNWDANERQILEGLMECKYLYRKAKREWGSLEPSIRKVTPKPPELLARYEDYLVYRGGWLTEDEFKGLYLRGEEEYAPETSYKCKGETVQLAKPRLPAVQLGMIRNPLVQRAMTTMRRLVNYLAEHGKLDSEDTIRIELARTVNDFATRRAWMEWQASRRKLNEEAVAEITALKQKVTDDAIERYVLWKEQDGRCLYTGKNIPVAKLFTGNEFDIEHTVPRSLSGDDSLANKTVCDATYNRQVKKGMVPRDCPNYEEIEVRLADWRKKLEDLEKVFAGRKRAAKAAVDPAAHAMARTKMLAVKFELDYWRDKLRRFEVSVDRLTVRDGELGGFRKRQLVDTGIMSSHAVALLKSVYPQTYAVNGAATAFARKAWGIQADPVKDRTEHTHHAVDAMVIAALSPSRFTAICTALKDDGQTKAKCAPPCRDFALKVKTAEEEILVKHILRQTTLRQSSKRNALAKSHTSKSEPGKIVRAVLSRGDTVRGALHKDTFYGCIKNPVDGALQKVVRKSLVGQLVAAAALVDKIVDPVIRDIVGKTIDELKSKGVKNIEPGMVRMPSGVPINKVRVFMPTATNASELRLHTMPSKADYKNPYYVTSAEGSNFRLAIFEENGKRRAVPDNSLDWAQNHKKPDYMPYHEQKGFVGYVMPGTMAIACRPEERTAIRSWDRKALSGRLYKVVKFEGTGRITFRHHTEARASVVLGKDLIAAGKHKAGESSVCYDKPHELLLLSSGAYFGCMLFEGLDFSMALDGTITFR